MPPSPWPPFSCIALDLVFCSINEKGNEVKEALLEDSIRSLKSVKSSRESCGLDRLIYTVEAAPRADFGHLLSNWRQQKKQCALLACLGFLQVAIFCAWLLSLNLMFTKFI